MGTIPCRCVRCALASMLLLALCASAAPRTDVRQEPVPPARTGALPADLLPLVNATVGGDDSAYRVLPEPTAPALLGARNPTQQLTATFAPDGVRFGGGAWGLRLDAVGYGGDLRPIAAAPPIVLSNRVEYRRGGVTEWYVNGPAGIEQGFTLATRPPGRESADLTLAVAAPGATVTPAGDGLLLTPREGGAPVRYGHLAVRDATGRALTARLEGEGGAIRIVVEAAGAAYPVVVDPLVQSAKLTGSGEVGNGHLGRSAALSGDGNTALIGARTDNSNVGAAYVFVRGGVTWTQQQRLTGTGEVGAAQFGAAAALSGDGTTVLVGANGDNGGAAYVFVRGGATWAQQQRLTGNGGVGNGNFGISAALSGDGTTALVGANQDNSSVGAAYVFVPQRYTVMPLVSTTPQSTAVGVAFPAAPAVRVLDQAGGQAVQGMSVTFAAPTAGASGTFTGGVATTTAATDASGIATAPTFTADATAGNYVVTATVSDGTSAVFQFTNMATAAASVIALTGGNQSATVGAAFATPLRALAQDAGGNPVSGLSVTFAAPGSGASSTFTGSTTVTTNSNGEAIAPAFTANTTAGVYTVTATASGVATPASFALTNMPGPVASLAISSFPASTVAGAAHTFTVTAKDASGNTVTGYTGTVHFTSSDGAATLPVNYTFTAADAGVHTFTATLKTVGSGRSITATDSGNSVNSTQAGIAVTPAVLSVSPMSGPQAGGGTVTITGIGLTGATSVTLGGAACTNVQVNGTGTSLTCTAPTNQPAGTVDVAVTTPNGTGTLTHGYTFLPSSVAPVPGGRSGAGGGGGGGNAPAAQPTGR